MSVGRLTGSLLRAFRPTGLAVPQPLLPAFRFTARLDLLRLGVRIHGSPMPVAWQHPWRCICLLLRAMVTEQWRDRWPRVRQEIPKAMAENWPIQQAGWFNLVPGE